MHLTWHMVCLTIKILYSIRRVCFLLLLFLFSALACVAFSVGYEAEYRVTRGLCFVGCCLMVCSFAWAPRVLLPSSQASTQRTIEKLRTSARSSRRLVHLCLSYFAPSLEGAAVTPTGSPGPSANAGRCIIEHSSETPQKFLRTLFPQGKVWSGLFALCPPRLMLMFFAHIPPLSHECKAPCE